MSSWRLQYLQPPVSSLQQVAKLQILEVGLKSQVVLSGVSHRGSADPLRQSEAGVAAPAAGLVVWRACGAPGPFPNGAGRRQLTGAVFVLADAAAELLGELPQLVVLRAVQQRLEVAQPVGPRAGARTESQKLAN